MIHPENLGARHIEAKLSFLLRDGLSQPVDLNDVLPDLIRQSTPDFILNDNELLQFHNLTDRDNPLDQTYFLLF